MALILWIKKHELVSCSLCSGFLLAISWPPWGLTAVSFVALVPLLHAENVLANQFDKNTRKRFFNLAFVSFLVFNLLTTWWIALSTLTGMVVAVVLNSAFMALPWWSTHVWRKVSAKQGLLPLLFFWLSFEHLHSQWELSWSWLDLGNVFAMRPSWVQWYEYTGVAGGTLWVLVVNIMAFQLVKELFLSKATSRFVSGKPRAGVSPGVFSFKRMLVFSSLAAFLFLAPLVYSLVVYHTYQERFNPVEVVIVQPSEDPYIDPDNRQEAEGRVKKMIELAKGKVTPRTRFVLLPEEALPGNTWLHQPQSNLWLQEIQCFMARKPHLHWVTGTLTRQLFENKDGVPHHARPMAGSTKYYSTYNSAVITNAAKRFDYYHKSRLVPGIEGIPYGEVLKPLGKVFSFFGGSAHGLGRQGHRSVFETDGGVVIAPVICYESIFGQHVAEYAKLGANIIFVMTNDGWWGKTPGYRQHNYYARLRAIELRKPIARAASTGISSFIDQRGRLLQQTRWGETTAIRQTLNLNKQLTYFARHGNFIGKASLFFSVLVLLAMLVQLKVKNKPN